MTMLKQHYASERHIRQEVAMILVSYLVVKSISPQVEPEILSL